MTEQHTTTDHGDERTLISMANAILVALEDLDAEQCGTEAVAA